MATELQIQIDAGVRRRLIHAHLEARMIGRSSAPSTLLVSVAESLQYLRQQGLLQRDSDVAAVAQWLEIRSHSLPGPQS